MAKLHAPREGAQSSGKLFEQLRLYILSALGLKRQSKSGKLNLHSFKTKFSPRYLIHSDLCLIFILCLSQSLKKRVKIEKSLAKIDERLDGDKRGDSGPKRDLKD